MNPYLKKIDVVKELESEADALEIRANIKRKIANELKEMCTHKNKNNKSTLKHVDERGSKGYEVPIHQCSLCKQTV